MLLVCCFGSTAVLKATLGLYTEDAINYSVETNYLEWETPFPAVTICEANDPGDRIKEYLNVTGLTQKYSAFLKDVLYWNSKHCSKCVNCKMNLTCIPNYLELIDKIRWNCTQMLTDCWWADEYFSCCDRFRPTRTEYGLCYVFNSKLTNEGKVITVNRRIGLPSLLFSAAKPVIIKIHSPDDMVSVALENALSSCTSLPLVNDFEASLRVEQTITDVAVQSISPVSRDCLFSHEVPSFAQHWPFKKYSYSACVLYCRAKAQTDVCNCTHHYMPNIGDFPTCNISGLACLHLNSDSLIVEGSECPMECDNVVYTTIQTSCFRHTGKLHPSLVHRGTRGSVKLGQLPTLRVRRHAIRDMLGLVVDFGGVVGVFFGASLLSVLEIVYLLCIRGER
ncbi:sodium channel protein Nach-like [Bombyx mandarina]|uniref:Sodium channel protein Nach-like n=1 Tax=Bombyx mandarina TaxID=7092 RepID=A0A6J2KRC0_BOMMA|nr:sodium channel protein Nach-like [Bombyx mandarina]